MASQLDFAGGTFVDGLVNDSDESLFVSEAAVETPRQLVIAFVGLAFEARIAAGPGVQVACRTAGSELEKVAAMAARQGYRGMISFGVAGGLASHLRAGDWVVASAIREVRDGPCNRPGLVAQASRNDRRCGACADCRCR